MTQLLQAREGKITRAMEQAAAHEGVLPESVREKLSRGVAVLPINVHRDFPARVIGQGFKTKVNANIGTSKSHSNLGEEMEKIEAAISAGADAVMDLSTGGDLKKTLEEVLKRSPVPVGTVPVYRVVSQVLCGGGDTVAWSADDLFDEIRTQAEMGVDFITVHCGITRHSVSVLSRCQRIMGVVSRGGSLMAEWMKKHDRENPLLERFDELLDICRAHDVTLSLGDGLRPGAIADAHDQAQITELSILGELAKRSRMAGVQAMIEGPGHVPLSRIAADVLMQKRLCDGAPYYVLGPLPTDVAPGYDHIVGAIGGAIAAAAGVDFLCYVTPAEHLHLPSADDVRQGVIASRIAAHIGDLEKGVPGAWDWDLAMSQARRKFNWTEMFKLALDPETAKARRLGTEDAHRDVCTMCGDMCAIKTFERAMEG
ncbi:MAG: phosphomethylpyrimidine synthase ThiC [Thermodesulfobacteriota bacterium]